MGSYAHLWLENLLLGSSRNNYDTDIISLFDDKDKVVVTDQRQNLPYQVPPCSDPSQDGDCLALYYRSTVELLRDRLELLGFTLPTAKEAFTTLIRQQAKDYLRYCERHVEDNIITDIWRHNASLLADLTPETWLDRLGSIHRLGLRQGSRGIKTIHEMRTLEEYMLEEDWYGYPERGNGLTVMRLVLELFENDQEVIYDLSEHVRSGYIDSDDLPTAGSEKLFESESRSLSNTIVLTEGTTDARILSTALRVLYPHLVQYFSFMDFQSMKVPGGAGNLVNLVKSFVGARVANRIVAVFDNDTAAAAAVSKLDISKLPPHVRILLLPNLDLLKSYPTIGPAGPAVLDVNSRAGGIELYLGEDVLRVESGLSPVQWTGFDLGVREYQGEVLHKDAIHTKFFEKAEAATRNRELIEKQDWFAMRVVLARLFGAFHDLDRQLILRDIDENIV